VVAQNYLTDVGAYTLSTSPYGTFDQGGNVWERVEAIFTGLGYEGGVRGGSWADIHLFVLRADSAVVFDPTSEQSHTGFRVATIPEPGTLCLGALAAAALCSRRRRG
jgi:formylglycine-generating enzyme required for sulfatase activity